MMCRLYHGSTVIVDRPRFEFGKKYRDFGLGFYCTMDLDMACEWACSDGVDGFLSSYELEMDGLNILDLTDKKYTMMNWLAILLENRWFETSAILGIEAGEYILKNYLPKYKDYDVIIGYRADDSYFSFAGDFFNGTISYRQLSNAMKLGKPGIQIVLKSKKVFSRIQFIEAVNVDSKIWFEKKDFRDKMERREYFNTKKNKRVRGDLYITTILDEEIKNDDPRLF